MIFMATCKVFPDEINFWQDSTCKDKEICLPTLTSPDGTGANTHYYTNQKNIKLLVRTWKSELGEEKCLDCAVCESLVCGVCESS